MLFIELFIPSVEPRLGQLRFDATDFMLGQGPQRGPDDHRRKSALKGHSHLHPLVGAAARLAEGALGKDDEAFYQGKVAAARFFIAEVLPKLTAERKIAERTDLSIMDLPEAAF